MDVRQLWDEITNDYGDGSDNSDYVVVTAINFGDSINEIQIPIKEVYWDHINGKVILVQED